MACIYTSIERILQIFLSTIYRTITINSTEDSVCIQHNGLSIPGHKKEVKKKKNAPNRKKAVGGRKREHRK